MADLSFLADATAKGAGKDREGVISVDGHSVRFSVPGSMGGKGVGASQRLFSSAPSPHATASHSWLSCRNASCPAPRLP
jgi:hypothetical protein